MKQGISELAVFGGSPAFAEMIHVGRPNVGDRARLQQRVDDVLDTRRLTNDGPYVQAFEAAIADRIGVAHCVAMCNATVALEILVRAIGLRGEVIVPSFTFVATAHALRWQEITPVFCDVDPATHNLDPAAVRALVTPQTSGILAVHLWGRPCDVTGLAAVAAEHQLQLVYDGAHAFGCSWHGVPLGGFGRAEVLSFHATKFINSFEGGAVVTDDAELAGRLRLMRNFGFADYDCVEYLGVNGKMTEVAAAMGLTSLESLEYFRDINRRHHARYREQLGDAPGLSVLTYEERDTPNYQYIVVEVAPEAAGLTRDTLLHVLHAENVRARRYFYPGCHRMEPYRTELSRRDPLVVTEDLCARVLVLPTGTAMRAEDVDEVCRILRLAVAHGPEVTRRIGADLVPSSRT